MGRRRPQHRVGLPMSPRPMCRIVKPVTLSEPRENDMNHIRTTTIRLIIVALAAALLLIAVAGLPGGLNPSAGQIAVQAAALVPRPHPISHLSFPAGIDLLHPRPHPESHLRSSASQP